MRGTPEAILRAASEVFASQGFQRATVREICGRAGANLAALNYHFGDKVHLYQAVLRTTLGTALLRFPPDLDLPPNATPEEQLRAFIRSFLLRTLDPDRAGQFGKLLAREIAQPSPAFEQILHDALEPLARRLLSILSRFPGAPLPALSAASILAQCLFFFQSRTWLARVFPEIPANDAERLADHVTRFSLHALAR